MCLCSFGMPMFPTPEPAYSLKFPVSLNAVGFNVELRLVSSMNELLTRIYSRQTQLFLLGEQIDFPDPDALFDRLFNSKSHGNPFGYHNPVVDRLLMEAQETLDDEQRARLYGEIEQMILADHAILPLACVKYSYVHSRRFKDLDVSVFWDFSISLSVRFGFKVNEAENLNSRCSPIPVLLIP